MPKITCVPKELKMDFSRILNKPFFIETFNWTTSTVLQSVIHTTSFPSCILNNYLAKVPFNSAYLYRLRACLVVQVSGTPLHQGCLVAAVQPTGVFPSGVTQMLQGPHSFLNANESTPICIEIPFYSRSPLAQTNYSVDEKALSPFNYADFNFMVVNPLSAGTNGSTTLTVSIHVVIKEAEFYVPQTAEVTWQKESYNGESFIGSLQKIPTKIFDGLAAGTKTVTGDFIDAMRLGLRSFTGFHNPNSAAINMRTIVTTRNMMNAVDQPTLIEKLDQHAQFDRIIQDYQFDTAQDEMDISFLLSKPVYETTFSVLSSTQKGKVMFARPISPYVEHALGQYFFSPMRLIYENSRFWRGSLKMHIQSSMSNFHFCKLLIVRDYSGNKALLNSFPKMDDMHNLMTETVEFSSGGQIKTIDLPYCAPVEQLECTKCTGANALQHGMVYIYLLQPLVLNGAVATRADFNVYFTGGDDLQFYGYSVDPIEVSFPVTPGPPEGGGTQPPLLPQVPQSNFIGESSTVGADNNAKDTLDQKEIVNNESNYVDSPLRIIDFKPMINLRDYVRRFHPLPPRTFTGPNTIKGIFQFAVGELLDGASSQLLAFRSLYFGFNGGIKCKVLIQGPTEVSVQYLPPGIYYDKITQTLRKSTATNSFLSINQNANVNPFKVNYSNPIIELASFQHLNSNNMNMLEFVIPNMNPFRFIGGVKPYTSQSDLSISDDMGQILITTNGVVSEPVTGIQFYVAFTDETRFGFQVYTPPMKIPVYDFTKRLSAFGDANKDGALISDPDFSYAYFQRT